MHDIIFLSSYFKNSIFLHLAEKINETNNIRSIETGFQKKIDVTRAKLSLSSKEIGLFL